MASRYCHQCLRKIKKPTPGRPTFCQACQQDTVRVCRNAKIRAQIVTRLERQRSSPDGVKWKHHTRPGYAARLGVLNRLGFADYQAYLRSDLWAKLRMKALELAGNLCGVCTDTASNVHHKDYSERTLLHGGASLIPLCRSCHEFIEFDQDGKKVRIESAGERLRLLRRLKSVKSRKRPVSGE